MKRPTTRASGAALLLTGTRLLAGCGDDAADPDPGADESSSPSAAPSTPDAPETTPEPSPSEPASTPPSDGPPKVAETVATGLRAPWGLDFLPNGDALVTERDTTKVLRISPEGDVTEVGTVSAAEPQGEAGLLGVAVSPDFATDSTVFLYATTAEDNRVLRATLDDDGLGEPEPVLTGIPNGFTHDGGRLEFGPDGFLYVSTGEAGDPPRAQDRDDLGGKILRITADGDPAPGNPFDTPVWSWGHRNVQGLAFVDDQLWASEFGDSTFDELNRIEQGANYGWPEVEGEGGGDEFTDPQLTWSTDEASPSGLAYAGGRLWMASLRGERLWRIDVDGDQASSPEAFFVGDHGRMRTVAAAPDGRLWLMTSNHDGRGDPSDDDDRILVIEP